MGSQTHTYVTLRVSNITYAEIAGKLRAAGYDHLLRTNGEIDMHGLALMKEIPRDEQLNGFCREPPCASPMCRREGRCIWG